MLAKRKALRISELILKMRISFELLSFLLLSICITNRVEGHVKLNVPRVRLPYFDSLSVNFTLQVDIPGCYKWTVSRSNVVALTPLGDSGFEGTECSDAVLLSAVPRLSPCCPAHAIVYAEEIHTKEVVRCDVIIDRIASISIVTTTKELHLEEAPSKFTIRGYGGQGNEFSTLEGVPFKWWLEANGVESSGTGDPVNTIRFIPFAESMYKVSTDIASLEYKRLQGSQVLIEGLKTGSGNIFARIADPLYKNIPPAEVRYVVIANLVLEPREIYVVPETVFPLQLLQMKQSRFVEIKLPSSVYTFEVSNRTVVEYEPKKSLVSALNYGDCKIVVRDKNSLGLLEDEEHPEALTTNIYVREPKFLSITVSPYRNLALVVGQEYEIAVEIYDSDNQRFFIGDNIKVKTIFDTDFLKINSSSENGTYHVTTPIRVGTTRIAAELESIRTRSGSIVVPKSAPRVQIEVDIFQRIAINPKQSVLPWDPNVQPRHEIRLNPSGGNGNFVWSSTNSSVVVVTQGGIAKTESFGYANVTAAMTINSNIRGHAKIYVLPPTSMKILDHIVEAEIGTAILVPLAFYTVKPDDKFQELIPYTSCTRLPFTVEVEDASFHYDAKTHYPHSKPACTYLPIIGKTLGSSLVTVTYQTREIRFTDSVTVSTFKPLKVVEPASLRTVLAVGSSRQVVFEGGPRPLVERSSGYFRRIHIENNTVAQAYELKPPHGTREDLYVYEVICRDIGETHVTIESGNNLQYSDDTHPVLRTAEILVICAEPAQIYFKVESEKIAGSKCPLEYSSAQVIRVPVPNYENTLVSVTVKDPEGRKFDNITSLLIDWESSDHLVSFKNQEFITTTSVSMNGYSTTGKSLQTIIPKRESGNVEIIAKIKGYRADIMRKLKIRSTLKLATPEDQFIDDQRRHSMELDLVSDVAVEPSQITLFNHPTYKVEVGIKDGSGYFEVNSTSMSVSKFVYNEHNRTILISPLNEGEGKIEVYDLCLRTRRIADISILVNGVGTVEVDVIDKLEKGQQAIANVKIYGKNGEFLPAEDLALIKLKPTSFNGDVLSVKQSDKFDAKLEGIQFHITGNNIGQTSLIFVADSHGITSRSLPKKVTVFSPLIISPGNLTLLVGSVYQFITQGGPQTDALVNFTIGTRSIASVSITGLSHGLTIGRTKVEAKSIDRSSPFKIYSKDTANINVVPFKGIKIHAPITKILSNYEMPLWAIEKEEGLEPSILLGDKYPLLSFEWQVSSKETADIYHSFQKYGYVQPAGDQIGCVFKGNQPGRVIVKLVANYSGSVFTDEIEIEVFEELKLVAAGLSGNASRYLLMTPNSELNLRTNRDATEKVVYVVQSSQDFNCLERAINCANQQEMDKKKDIITVDNTGVVRSFDSSGLAVVLIYVREETGIVQSITATIQVKSVHYMMVNPVLPHNLTDENKFAIPRGITFPLTLTYHDNVGRIFDSTNLLAKSRPNRFDLVQLNPGLENNTFVAQSLAEGRISIKMLCEQDGLIGSLRDYLIFSIAEPIQSIVEAGGPNLEDSVLDPKLIDVIDQKVNNALDSLSLGKAKSDSHSSDGPGGIWSILTFFKEMWSSFLSGAIIVLITLAFLKLGSKYFMHIGDVIDSNPESESVFLSNPRADSTHIFAPKISKDRLSFSPDKSSGDAGYSTQRLFSSPDDGLYGSTSSSYMRRTPS